MDIKNGILQAVGDCNPNGSDSVVNSVIYLKI